MLFCRIPRRTTSFNGCRWWWVQNHHHFYGPSVSDHKVSGCREILTWALPALHGVGRQIHYQSNSVVEHGILYAKDILQDCIINFKQLQGDSLLAGQTAEVAMLAYEYGKNLGLAYQLIDDVLDFTGTSASFGKGALSNIRHGIVTASLLCAIEEFPQLRAVIDQGLDNPANVDLALEYLGKSCGIQRARELATEHANLAAAAIDSLSESDDEDVRTSRRALVNLTQRVITRTK